MDRGAWRSTVYGLARVGHDLGTKPPRSTLGNGSDRRKTGSGWVRIDSRRDGCGQQPGRGSLNTVSREDRSCRYKYRGGGERSSGGGEGLSLWRLLSGSRVNI